MEHHSLPEKGKDSVKSIPTWQKINHQIIIIA
jgi:hypothetical protein